MDRNVRRQLKVSALEVGSDPLRRQFGFGRALGCVVLGTLSEKNDRDPVLIDHRASLVIAKRNPVVDPTVIVRDGESAIVAVDPSHDRERADSVPPTLVHDTVRVAGTRGDLRADAEVLVKSLCSARRRELVDVPLDVFGGHPDAVARNTELRNAADEL